MKVLGIETSAAAASAAVAENSKVISEAYINIGLTHSQTLMELIDDCLRRANTSISEIDAIAVTSGPGSFTGVRIGIATAKGLAEPLNIPCISVSTLQAIAYPLMGTGCIAAAVMDARCNQVYSADFLCQNNMERLCVDSAVSLDELKSRLSSYNIDSSIVFIGDGAEVAHKYFNERYPEFKVGIVAGTVRFQSASSVAIIGCEEFEKGKTIDASVLVPIYLRPSQAERELKRKTALQR
ncbi:MAG TPA: tRNA (adenosine(37)-N6)-threonylcarbamoyltransferase complex dimerization subunit type 1 TsaB [Clostridiales bacterium]|nr:tRNA (adenosine(37)-N6)-threonylcarbamoyltransferase complex dimerization subunit type 1 TsaB [Clostridiales bacterium]HXK84007.1 tRNA (adenosine(37)-N6)-threonylcarbamoyltransferase complex dimerization subunit type 1 TsaB [Clostridiales bacterium]